MASSMRLLVDALRAAEVFEAMPPQAIERLVENGRDRVFEVGQTLMHQGDPADCIYVILSGRLRVERANQPDQPAVVLAELGPGEVVGEMGVLDHTPRSATVVALERVEVLEVAASAVNDLLAEFPEFAGTLRHIVSSRLRNTDALAAELFAELLRKVPMFRSVSTDALSRLAERGQLRTFAPGTALVRQGDPGAAMYVLASGRVQVERAHPALLAPMPLAELGPGEVIGELEVLDGAPRAASVIALDHVEAMEVSADALADTMAHFPDVAAALLQAVTRRLRNTDELLDQRGTP